MGKDALVKAVEARFAKVVAAFDDDVDVHVGEGKGFGSGTLKVKGKIFAMISSKGEFVVKLPKARVDELIAAGKGEPFDAGKGRPMKEWAVVPAPRAWVKLAKEARAFVGR